MPQQLISSVENNFTKGYVTEFTGLNFPENAATDTSNCMYTLVGNVVRRQGIDFEENYQTSVEIKNNYAINTYKWNNAGGEGLTEVIVTQVGDILSFYKSSAATDTSPLSAQILGSTIDIGAYIAPGVDEEDIRSIECQFTSGNGYLFVYHPNLDPFYCTYVDGVITANRITVQIRDFSGIPEPGIADTVRLNTLSNEHEYNLTNQGWTAGGPWQAFAGQSETVQTGSHSFGVGTGLSATVGQHVSIYTRDGPQTGSVTMSGTLTSYVGATMTIFVDSVDLALQNNTYSSWSLIPSSNSYIDTWHTQVGNYPSNADVWWRFKDSNNVFSPASLLNSVTLSTPAPKGHFILSAFSQDRALASSISGLTPITTTVRPRTGTWFQGRVWYAGVDASQAATGDAPHYSWTENIYFSQVVTTADDFGKCYQLNDPTNEDLFDLLPTDGGVITIPGCGSVFKLFPIQNGMLIFAANGIWFLTGSTGIGFSAVDYTITKISSVQSISASSFVDVLGLPYFWNEEGIYQVAPQQGGGLQVEPITVSTILSYYESIPTNSKKYVKAAYHPLDYVIQWVYRSTDETDVTSRYQFDTILNYNTYNKAFYPYSIGGPVKISTVQYVNYPGGTTAPAPGFKYLCYTQNGISPDSGDFTFADEHDIDYVDWASVTPTNYISYFITGYKVHGKGMNKMSISYLNTFSNCEESNSFSIQGIWDYYGDPNSGKWSVPQFVNNIAGPRVRIRRHKIRGRGYVLQFRVSSTDGMPFNILGWSVLEAINQGA